MYLFFDTETTGLPKNWQAPITDSDNWPRLVQIAWLAYNNSGKEISGRDYIIKPEGFVIPDEAAAVHGITTEKAEAEGVILKDVLKEFSDNIKQAKSLVAHNISFDEKIAGAEFFRKNINNRILGINKVCTMHSSTDFCKIPGNYGYKWPKLSELHTVLFNEDFENAHDALADVRACARCFFKLKDLKIINE